MAKKSRGKKPQPEVNLNPYKDWPLKQVTMISVPKGSLEVYVAFQNAGMTWFSPTIDDRDEMLYKGLIVFQCRTDGTIKECYDWGSK